MIWSAPTGKTYKTLPGSRKFFPDWNTTTAAELPQRPAPPPDIANRSMMMPKRRRTRAAPTAPAASQKNAPSTPPTSPNVRST